jgi:hypothetical protein
LNENRTPPPGLPHRSPKAWGAGRTDDVEIVSGPQFRRTTSAGRIQPPKPEIERAARLFKSIVSVILIGETNRGTHEPS